MQNFSIASIIVFSIAYTVMVTLVLLMFYITQCEWVIVLGMILIADFIITVASLLNNI